MLDLTGRNDSSVARKVVTPAHSPMTSLLPLSVKNLTKEIDGQRLVDNLSFEVAGAGMTVILGANGAGKSLLLRLLHGLLAPTSGTITWGGRPQDRDMRRHQAMVFQKPVLLRRSVAANIDFVLKLKGERNHARRDAILDSVALLSHARQPARLLSGGEQQRLALARALALEPDILFLDEPTASLDPASVAMIEEVVRGANNSGTKVLFVTHQLGQARRLADDVIFLHRGRLCEQGPASAFFAEPTSEPARAYLEGRIVY